MTEYEIKCPQTWAWYTGYVHDFDMNEKKFYVTYPDDWKQGEWIDAQSIRYKFDDNSYNLLTWIPREDEEVECKARAEEREPYGWWPCKAKPYKSSSSSSSSSSSTSGGSTTEKLYSVAFVGWGDQHNEILGGEYIRPRSKSKSLSIRNMNKDTYSVPNELKEWMSSQNNLFETLVPNKANNKLIHLKYDSSSNKLTLIGTKRVLDTTKDIIYCFCEKQKTLLKLEEKTQELEMKSQLKKEREEKAFKYTFNIHPLLSGYLRGRAGSNITKVQKQKHDQILTINPKHDSCYIAAMSQEALNYAIDQLQIVAKKIKIPTSEMGQIIGFQGQQIQDIKKKSNVIKIISWDKWTNEEFHNLKQRHINRYKSYDDYNAYQNGVGYDDDLNENEEIPAMIKNATVNNLFEEDDIVDLTDGYNDEIDDIYNTKTDQQQQPPQQSREDALVVIGRKSRVEICIVMIQMTLTHFRTITKTRNNVKLLRKKINEIKGNPDPPYRSRGRGRGRSNRGRGGYRGRGSRGRSNRGNRGRGYRYRESRDNRDNNDNQEDDDMNDDQKDNQMRNTNRRGGGGGRGSRRGSRRNRRGGDDGGGGRQYQSRRNRNRQSDYYGGGGGYYAPNNNGYNENYNNDEPAPYDQYGDEPEQPQEAQESQQRSTQNKNKQSNKEDTESNDKNPDNKELNDDDQQQTQPKPKRKKRGGKRRGKGRSNNQNNNAQPSS